MKKIILLITVVLSVFSANAQTKIGTIDAEYIVSLLPEMTQVETNLKTYNQELQTDLDSTITRYETLVTDYQENNATLSEEERRKKETEIIALENEIKGFRQKASVMMQMKRNELTKPLYEKVNNAMLQVVQEEGYTQILHAGGASLAFSATRYDITDEVLTKLGVATEEAAE